MKKITGAQGAFIVRILMESMQSMRAAGKRLLEAGFTGERKDKLGHTRYYRDGRQVKNPNAQEKASIKAAAGQPLPAGQAPSHNDAATRVNALAPDTPPQQVKALANDLMQMDTKDLEKMAQDEPQKRTSYAGENGDVIQTPGGYIDIQFQKNSTSPRKQSVIGFVVDEDKRGQGIGDKLLKQAKQKYPDLGGQVSSKASLKVFYNNGFRSPDMPEASFAETLQHWQNEGGSLFMAANDENGKPYATGNEPKQSTASTSSTSELSPEQIENYKNLIASIEKQLDPTKTDLSRYSQEKINGVISKLNDYRAKIGLPPYQTNNKAEETPPAPAAPTNTPKEETLKKHKDAYKFAIDAEDNAESINEKLKARDKVTNAIQAFADAAGMEFFDAYDLLEKENDEAGLTPGLASKSIKTKNNNSILEKHKSDYKAATDFMDAADTIDGKKEGGKKQTDIIHSLAKELGIDFFDAYDLLEKENDEAGLTPGYMPQKKNLTNKPFTQGQPGFTGTDSQGRQWQDGKLVAAKDELTGTASPAAGMNPEALALDALRLKQNRKPHNASHITPDAVAGLKAKGLIDDANKITDKGREQLYAAKNKTLRKATGPKATAPAAAPAAPTNLGADADALEALRLKSNRKQHIAGHITPEAIASLKRQGFIDDNNKLTMMGRAHLAAQKGSKIPSQPEASKAKRASRNKDSLISIVRRKGGINSDSVKAGYDYKNDIIEGGLLHAIRKQGMGLDEMAQTLMVEGHIIVPEGVDPGEHLLNEMKARHNSALKDTTKEIDLEQEAYYKAKQAALEGGHDERSIEGSGRSGVQVGESAGQEEGYRALDEWDNSGAGTQSGGETSAAVSGDGYDSSASDDYDRNATTGPVDTSFDFGFNVKPKDETPAEPTPEPAPTASEPEPAQAQAPTPTPAAPTATSPAEQTSDELLKRHLQRQGFTGIDAQGREWRNGELVAAQPEEPKQKRAAKGGEIGPNGEHYKGGAFIATTELPKRLKDKIKQAAGNGKEKVMDIKTGRWEFETPPNPGLMSIFSRLPMGIYIDPKGNLFEPGLHYPEVVSKEKRREITELAEKYRAGEKWVPINDYPIMAKKKHIYQLAAAGLPISGALLDKVKDDLDFQKYYELQKSKNDKPAEAPALTPAGNTDLFGNPTKPTPKGPETMPGLFGDQVPVAPDAPTPTAGEPLPGSDNPLDRPGAGRGKQDGTQDMFGLFGPSNKAKVDAINNGPDPVTEPSTPAAAADQDQPNDTPRTKAARVSAALAGDFENARDSAVPNMGVDLKGSARHRAMAWKGLKDAEANGTAEALVRRDELLKHEPSNLFTILKPETSLSVLTSHLAMQAFPKEVHQYEKYVRSTKDQVSTPAQLRAQYYEAFTEIKKLSEDLATQGKTPKEITAALKTKVSDLIDKFRKKGQGEQASYYLTKGQPHYLDGDRYNPVANSLADMYNRLANTGSTSVMGRVNDFGKRLQAANGNAPPTLETLHTATKAIGDILEGKSFNQAFDTVQKKGAGFDYSAAYGDEIIRKGGKKINMEEQSKDRPGSKVFMDDMKVRGVQFGNSLPDQERIYHAEKSAEALSDLTDILGLPMEAAGLGGKLGLAIGARGRAGAKAHFEPWQADDKANPSKGGPVINLTRASGAGSLAHEWGHGLDHFAAGNEPGETKFLSEGRGTPKTVEAMRKVQEAMDSSGFSQRLKIALRGELQSKYWYSDTEKFARTFERHVQNKLRNADRENTYLTGLKHSVHPYWPNNDEMAHIAPHMDALIAAIAAEKFPNHKMPAPAPATPKAAAPAPAPAAASKEEKPKFAMDAWKQRGSNKKETPYQSFEAIHGRPPTFQELHGEPGGLLEKQKNKTMQTTPTQPNDQWVDVTPAGYGPSDDTPPPAATASKDSESPITASAPVKSWAQKKFKNPEHAQNFAKWFGDSKVVNDQGEPLVLYHGAGKSFDAFDKDQIGTGTDVGRAGAGFYFTSDTNIGSSYASMSSGKAQIYPVYLQIKNPLVLSKKEGESINDAVKRVAKSIGVETDPRFDGNKPTNKEYAQEFRRQAIKAGYDGTITNFDNGSFEANVFEPNQIKSALGNQGTFDPNSPKITESTDPHAEKIKLVQAIIARRGIKPPQPKAQAKKTPEASGDADPRVKRIRELMDAYC